MRCESERQKAQINTDDSYHLVLSQTMFCSYDCITVVIYYTRYCALCTRLGLLNIADCCSRARTRVTYTKATENLPTVPWLS